MRVKHNLVPVCFHLTTSKRLNECNYFYVRKCSSATKNAAACSPKRKEKRVTDGQIVITLSYRHLVHTPNLASLCLVAVVKYIELKIRSNLRSPLNVKVKV